jgi:hypothetical protein
MNRKFVVFLIQTSQNRDSRGNALCLRSPRKRWRGCSISPLAERKARLAKLVGRSDRGIVYNGHTDEGGAAVAARVQARTRGHRVEAALEAVEGATENAATVQALIDNLVERGLDPAVPRLFIIDGAKALSKAIRRTFGRTAAIQRCQARNIMERLPKALHASVRRALRQAW